MGLGSAAGHGLPGDRLAGKFPASIVSFRISTAKLAALIKTDGGSAQDLFIELYESGLGMWVPLQSHYDALTHTESAVAPHLSKVGLGWIVRAAEIAAFPDSVGADAATALIEKELGQSFIAEFKEELSPGQESDGCGGAADTAWTVSSQIQHVTGCVGVSPAHDLQLENDLLRAAGGRPAAKHRARAVRRVAPQRGASAGADRPRPALG